MIEHSFQLNEIYWDTKRKAYCELVNMMPYKQRTKGHYVDFRYDNGTHIRKPLHEAINRFTYAEFKTNETQNEVLERFADLPEWTGPVQGPEGVQGPVNDGVKGPPGISGFMQWSPGLGKANKAVGMTFRDEAIYPPLGVILNKIYGFQAVRIKYDNVIYVDFINKVVIE